MGSTRDIADVALRRLLALDFQGASILELEGPELVNLRQIASLIGAALGRAFPAQPTARDADIEGMAAAGIGRDFGIEKTEGSGCTQAKLGEPRCS
jgi:uncharacterized protein YbjT (DUF2867 family)